MSIDINWSTLTTGPDGVALAEKIRDFVHDKFQTAVLPPFIKSVKVETFEFGTIAPEIEIKDICDPLPDFYEEIESDESDSGEENNSEEKAYYGTFQGRYGENQKKDSGSIVKGSQYSSSTQPADLRLIRSPMDVGNSHGTSTPGIPGGTSNLNYFHSHLATNLSGSRTPLAAVAGAHLYNGWPDCSYPFHRKRDLHAISECSTSPPTSAGPGLQEKSSALTLVTSSNDTRPSTRDGTTVEESPKKERFPSLSPSPMPRLRKTRVEDIQTVFRVKYSGDVKLSLTAEILLDYPMPCFIGIPIQLRITGFTFDGVAVLASIRKRVHFCFLSPEDSLYSTINDSTENIKSIDPKVTSLLQEIKVESEIGKREGGKQLLKNVGKVEKFVLEQVRRIFEDELVYPSFWTFLI